MEQISAGGRVLAYLVRRESEFHETEFVSPPEAPLQLGFVSYGAGKSIARHVHLPVERRITGTSEFLWVRKGRCEVDIYDDARQLVTTVELRTGDALLLLAGGHGFRMTEDTVLAEVKQGPYFGLEEKRAVLMVPVSAPWFLEEDAESVADCVRSGWVSSAGKAVLEFEDSWAAFCGRKCGIAMSSGMSALQAAVAALQLQPGDEVIIPTFTIISCALAVIYNGAVPVLVDSDPLTWCLDVAQIEAKIGPCTRAIMPVHMYGHPVDMDPLIDIAERRGLAVIEDAAEAHGAEYLNRAGNWLPCGSFGDMSCFSFYANKVIATGEGGMVLTDDADLAARLRSLRDLCFQPDKRFAHAELGHNFRMTNMQAALGLSQVKRIETLLARKRWIAQRYCELLADIHGLEFPPQMPWARSIFWMFGIVLGPERGLEASELSTLLRDRGVETRPFFLGMHEQPVFQKRFAGQSYPVAERLSRFGLYLPSGLGTTPEQLEIVSDALHRVLA